MPSVKSAPASVPRSSLASLAATCLLAESSRAACSNSTPSGGTGEVRSLMATHCDGSRTGGAVRRNSMATVWRRRQRQRQRRGTCGRCTGAPAHPYLAAIGLCRCPVADQAYSGPRRGCFGWAQCRAHLLQRLVSPSARWRHTYNTSRGSTRSDGRPTPKCIGGGGAAAACSALEVRFHLGCVYNVSSV